MADMDAIELEELARGRPIWSGTVSFGLVSVPVNIMPANRPSPIAFHLVSSEGEQLRRRYFAEKREPERTRRARRKGGGKTAAGNGDGASRRALTQDDIVRGYEWKKGKFVVVDDDELERIAPERTRDIDLRVFVDVNEVDPMYFVRAYYLTPVGSPKAYKLLATVMEERRRAGIATFVMRAKEYVAAILAEHGILRVETLRFADEIRSPKAVGLPDAAPARTADVKKIEGMIKRLSKSSVDKRLLEDRSAGKLEALAKRKAKEGEDVVAVPEPEEGDEEPTSNVIDLMERLQESLRGGRAPRSSAAPSRAHRRRAHARRA